MGWFRGLPLGWSRWSLCHARRGSLVEEFVDGDGLVAARAQTADSEAAHEGAAVVAALLTESAVVAVGAFVDGVGPAGLLGGEDDGIGGVGLVAAPVGCDAAGVAAVAAFADRLERGGADRARDRYWIVTRRAHAALSLLGASG